MHLVQRHRVTEQNCHPLYQHHQDALTAPWNSRRSSTPWRILVSPSLLLFFYLTPYPEEALCTLCPFGVDSLWGMDMQFNSGFISYVVVRYYYFPSMVAVPGVVVELHYFNFDLIQLWPRNCPIDRKSHK